MVKRNSFITLITRQEPNNTNRYSKPELILEPNAFAPFSMGRYGCVGKNLAYMEIRAVIANIITKFDVSFGPGEDGSRLLNETKDCFTLVMAPLNLTFTPRSKA
jgi:cytochrome P450